MTKYTAFRCPVDLLPKALIKAKADRRSLSNYITLLIERDTTDVVLPAQVAKSVKAAKAPKAPKTAAVAKAPKAKAAKPKKSPKK